MTTLGCASTGLGGGCCASTVLMFAGDLGVAGRLWLGCTWFASLGGDIGRGVTAAGSTGFALPGDASGCRSATACFTVATGKVSLGGNGVALLGDGSGLGVAAPGGPGFALLGGAVGPG